MSGLWKAIFITLLLVIIIGAVYLISNTGNLTEIAIEPGEKQKELQYSIYGAVAKPGIYNSKDPVRIGEAAETAGGLTGDADPERANLSKWIRDGETIIIPTKGPVSPTLTPFSENDELIDLNSAGLQELMKLPGIGEKRASDIIRLREEKGGFQTKEEILEISGISEKLLESIYDRLIIR